MNLVFTISFFAGLLVAGPAYAAAAPQGSASITVGDSSQRAGDDNLALYDTESFTATKNALATATKCSVVVIRAPNAIVWVWLKQDPNTKMLVRSSTGYVSEADQIARYDELLKGYPEIRIEKGSQPFVNPFFPAAKRDTFAQLRSEKEIRELSQRAIDAVKGSCG